MNGLQVINQIGVSGGKDSTALLLWAIHKSGYPRESLRVTFCDTGNEAPETYDQIRLLSAHCVEHGVEPIIWLTPEMQFYELCIHKKIFPSVKRRFCTTELKLVPSRDYCYSLEAQGYKVVVHTGVRCAEKSTGKNDRSKLPPRDIDDFSGLEVFRPILCWTIDDVWAIHEEYGIPRNPLYALGMSRVGCFPCVMSKKRELRNIALHRPERVDYMRDKERLVNARCPGVEEGGAGSRAFFHAGTIPKKLRTGADIIDKKGRPNKLATIDDVFRWSRTSRGGMQFDIDYDEAVSCPMGGGMCE